MILLWAINIVEVIFFSFKTYPLIRSLYNKHKQQVEAARAKGQKFPIYKNRGLFGTGLFFVVGLPAQVAVACVRISSPG